MSGTVRKAMVGASAVVSLAALVASVSVMDLGRSWAQCNTTNQCSLVDNDDVSHSGQLLRDFTFTLTATWNMTATPFIGAVEMLPVGQGGLNVTGVQYDPAYWFPPGCVGGQIVTCTGEVVDEDQAAVVNTKLDIGGNNQLHWDSIWATDVTVP